MAQVAKCACRVAKVLPTCPLSLSPLPTSPGREKSHRLFFLISWMISGAKFLWCNTKQEETLKVWESERLVCKHTHFSALNSAAAAAVGRKKKTPSTTETRRKQSGWVMKKNWKHKIPRKLKMSKHSICTRGSAGHFLFRIYIVFVFLMDYLSIMCQSVSLVGNLPSTGLVLFKMSPPSSEGSFVWFWIKFMKVLTDETSVCKEVASV